MFKYFKFEWITRHFFWQGPLCWSTKKLLYHFSESLSLVVVRVNGTSSPKTCIMYLEPKWPLFWMERALFLGGWPSKIEVIWVPGKYIWYGVTFTTSLLVSFPFCFRRTVLSVHLFPNPGKQLPKRIGSWLAGHDEKKFRVLLGIHRAVCDRESCQSWWQYFLWSSYVYDRYNKSV